jgi:ABC-type transport system involved in multi-copper enzyme maturation permease subunit
VLPIVQRELQVAARSPRFYAWRLRTGVALVLVSLGIILSTRGGLHSAAAGQVFRTLCFFALVFCLAEGLRKTSDSISEEKREGTLGFLFLTDLSGFDVILGKLAAAAVRSFNALLAFVPVLAVSLLLGGTTGGEFWRMVLGLAVCLGTSLSTCIFASTMSRERSLAAAVSILFAICFAPMVARLFVSPALGEWILAASPFFLVPSAGSDGIYGRVPGVYWAGIGWLLIVSFLSVSAASLVLPHAWQDKPHRTSGTRRIRTISPRTMRKRRLMLDRNPATWLMFDPRRQAWLHGFVYVCAIGAVAAMIILRYVLPRWNLKVPDEFHLAVAMVAGLAMVLAAFLYTAREASRNLAEARQNGALELVLSTPLNVDAIIQGQLLALMRALAPPAAIVAVLTTYVLLFASFFPEVPAILLVIKAATESVLGIFTVAWFGMWMGLTSKGATRAYLKTIAIGIVLPHVVCTPTIVNQLVLLVVAADRVKVHFRRFVAERYVGTHATGLPPVSAKANETTPPVLREV